MSKAARDLESFKPGPRAPAPVETRSFTQPVRMARNFEAAIENIVEGIELRHLRAGDRLPNEGELAAQLGLSKPTLRQALRILERAGLLSVRRGANGGIFVASDLIPTELISSFIALEEIAVVEVLVGRRLLETAVTNLAVMAAADEDYAELERTTQLMDQNVGRAEAFGRADAMFHRAIARACHNRTLQGCMRQMARELEPIRWAYKGGVEEDRRTVAVHRRQLDAMRERDTDELAQVLNEHFRMLEDTYAEMLHVSWEEVFGNLALFSCTLAVQNFASLQPPKLTPEPPSA